MPVSRAWMEPRLSCSCSELPDNGNRYRRSRAWACSRNRVSERGYLGHKWPSRLEFQSEALIGRWLGRRRMRCVPLSPKVGTYSTLMDEVSGRYWRGGPAAVCTWSETARRERSELFRCEACRLGSGGTRRAGFRFRAATRPDGRVRCDLTVRYYACYGQHVRPATSPNGL